MVNGKIIKLLGVDYGDARTGLAVSDGLGITAVGYGCVKSYNPEKAAAEIVSIAEKLGIGTIVIGKPINMNGTIGPRAEKALAFGEMISSKTTVPVVFFDERRTTVQAHGILDETGVFGKKRKAVIDTLSAELILQTYMDIQKNKNKG